MPQRKAAEMATKLASLLLATVLVGGCACNNHNGDWSCESVPPGIWHAGVNSKGEFQVWVDPGTAIELTKYEVVSAVKRLVPVGRSARAHDGPSYEDGEMVYRNYFHPRDSD